MDKPVSLGTSLPYFQEIACWVRDLGDSTVGSLTTALPRYIVYDIAQVNLKYLLKLKFNFKTSLW
jgi:hypothetical protein